MENYCKNHPDKKALSICHNCNEYYCDDCLSEGMSYYYCKKESCQVEFQKEKPPSIESMKNLDKKLASSSKTSYILVSIIFLALAGTIGKEIAKKIFSPTEVISVEPSEWKVRNFQNIGLSIESPFELNEGYLELPSEYKSMVKEMKFYQYTSDPFSVNITYALYFDDIVPSLDGAANGAINNMRIAKGVENFTSSISNVNLGEIPGRMIKGSFKIQKQSAEFIGVIYISGLNTWQILCTYLNHSENRVIVNKIITSVKIAL